MKYICPQGCVEERGMSKPHPGECPEGHGRYRYEKELKRGGALQRVSQKREAQVAKQGMLKRTRRRETAAEKKARLHFNKTVKSWPCWFSWHRPCERCEGAGANSRPFHETAEPTGADFDTSQGRWPANVVLSHLEDCEQVGVAVVKGDQRKTGNGKRPGGFAAVGADAGDAEPNSPVYGDEELAVWNCAPGCPVAALDEQSGERPGGGSIRNGKGMGYHGGDGVRERAPMGDSGGASRFLYCAKTSRAERDAGLEDFEPMPPAALARGLRNTIARCPEHDAVLPSGGNAYACGCPQAYDNGEEDRRSQQRPGANGHPTVKPINLMRWLVRLVTPPGGVVLDNFGGSGSTGCAAVLEGFDVILIEREPEYVEICKARIAFWAQHEGREVEDVLKLNAKSTRAAKEHADRGQGDLLALTAEDVISDIEGSEAA